MDIKSFSREITVFHGRKAPEVGILAGYGAIIEAWQLPLPMPSSLCLISSKNRQYSQDQWKVFTNRHLPEDNLYRHLVFALKYEGINLLFFKKLFEMMEEAIIVDLLQIEPLGQYSRKIWFLYEWLSGKTLSLPDLKSGNYVELVDMRLQYALGSGVKSSRHRITNNLPGTKEFCPLINRTPILEQFINEDYAHQNNLYLQGVSKEMVHRASAFLLLKDSKASFTIEGENLKSKRAVRWGQAIAQAGTKELSKEEFYRLQQLVIENPRFLEMGYRQKGGFVGEHDRSSGEPIPDHISAKWQDLESLLAGLIATDKLLLSETIDAVLAASVIAFGFVFIHPFEDGNGRIHRYLIHHVLAKKQFSKQGIIFPVSAAILNRISDYRKVLESYSLPLLDFIQWRETNDHNIEVLKDTMDYYRYFDATRQAEFLYECVKETIENIIPAEIDYLTKYDTFKRYLDNEFEMPDKLVAMLIRFLEQNKGTLSKRAKEKEFSKLTEEETSAIENNFQMIFGDM